MIFHIVCFKEYEKIELVKIFDQFNKLKHSSINKKIVGLYEKHNTSNRRGKG